MTAPPLVDRRVLEALLDIEMPRAVARNGASAPRLVIVHGRYRTGAPTEFSVRVGERHRHVRVSDQSSVLGVIDAWESHHTAAADAGADDILVVTTPVDVDQLGADVRGHALGRKALSVDRAEIVKQRFGAADLDPRIRQEEWLVEGLLAAEPADGWRTHPAAAAWRRGGGSVLTRDAAVHALVEARLDLSRTLPGPGHAGQAAEAGQATVSRDLDADTLLAWSRAPGATARFAALPEEERDGLAAWLRQTAGDAAAVLLALAGAGRGEDAMPLGVVGAVLTGPGASGDAGVALGGLFAGVPVRPDGMRAFTTAVQGTLARWISEAEQTRQGAARDRVLAVVDRADRLAVSAGLGRALADDPYLRSGLHARLLALAGALQRAPRDADHAMERIRDHRLARLFAERCEVAEMAVRVRRWLDLSTGERITSVADGVRRHLNEWGWVDRALNVLWAGDPDRDPVLGHAYRAVFEEARARRAELDEAFAGRLETWAPTAGAQAPGGTLPIESVMAEVVVPLASQGAPLVLVLDGMSSSVAAQIGQELVRNRWLEATSTPGKRRAAIAMMPSITTVSRASLLSGASVAGGQAVEANGFAAFWKRHRRQAALFHKSQIAGGAGHRLAGTLLDALAEDTVVGVVLNTIDDALDHDREGDRVAWKASHITFLTDLLNAARDYARPVVLVSDHGHVLERGEPGAERADASKPRAGAGAARWRTGKPGEGEVELSGPRVLEGGGGIVAPWREDIRYTRRKAGYHGGASLAEMTVPVLVLLPALDLLPKGWTLLPPEETVPRWWEGRPSAPGTAPVPAEPVPAEPVPAEPVPAEPVPAEPEPDVQVARKSPRQRKHEPQASEPLFPVDEAVPATTAAPASTARTARTARTAQDTAPLTLGTRVTRSPVYAEQKKYLRKAPEARQVAAVIDALTVAGRSLSPAAVGAAAADAGGRAPRNAEMFITALQRLLNIEGYPVLELADSGRTVRLDVELLREQFGLGTSAS